MEHTWIWITLLAIIGIGLFYVGYQKGYKRNPIAFIRAIIDEFMALVATLVFGSFGFRWDLFNEKKEGNAGKE